MRIQQAEVLVASPGRNFVTLRLTTDDGLTGVGDATLNGRELAVAAYLREHVAPLLVGIDPHRIEDTWQLLYRGAYWRRGPVTMAAIAAVDMALWDIKGKAAGLPVYQLLGGQSRTGCMAYAHAHGRTVEELFEAVRQRQEQGYRAIRLQSGVPGLGNIYGVGASTRRGDAARWPTPMVEEWDTPKYLRFVPTVFERARSEFGEDLHLLHDAHHRLAPIEAARLAKDLEPYRLFWLEDTVTAEDPAAVRLVRAASTTPLAIGEVFNSIYDVKPLIDERLIDYVRMAVTHSGGITPLKRIFEYAGISGIRTGAHGPEDISPVGFAAALHLGLSVHNFGIQEYAGYSEAAVQLFQPGFSYSDGYLHPGDAPGLGVSYDDAVGAAHEYRTSYLPVNRLTDGTVHDW
jgi:mannonate dehydratase